LKEDFQWKQLGATFTSFKLYTQYSNQKKGKDAVMFMEIERMRRKNILNRWICHYRQRTSASILNETLANAKLRLSFASIKRYWLYSESAVEVMGERRSSYLKATVMRMLRTKKQKEAHLAAVQELVHL